MVIVAWNNYDDTHECLESILAQQKVETEIFLVDNGSKIEPLENLKTEFPTINYIQSETNLGFSAGTNLGLRKALNTNAEWFLIINNDTKADEHMLQALLCAIKNDSIGLSAPLIYYYDSPNEVWSSGGRINKLLLMPLDSHNRRKTITQPIERSFVSGCCYLLKKDMLLQVGMFDDRFFLYFEDLDFSKRVSNSGWKMVVTPSAKLYHKVSKSSGGQQTPAERYHYARSSGFYYRKHLSLFNAIPIIIFRVGSAVLTSIRLLLQGKTLAIRSYWEGLRIGWFSKIN